MSELFSYFEGNLQDFLCYIRANIDNTLVKVKLEAFAPDSFIHVLDCFAVRHILTKHSNEKEVQRGQIIITESDFMLIPEILDSYDSCETTIDPKGRKLLLYTKEYQDCTRFYVEEIRKGRHELAGVTYYKRKRKLTGAKS